MTCWRMSSTGRRRNLKSATCKQRISATEHGWSQYLHDPSDSGKKVGADVHGEGIWGGG